MSSPDFEAMVPGLPASKADAAALLRADLQAQGSGIANTSPFSPFFVLLGAIFAKVFSTASNFLFSPATNLVNDIFVRYLAPDASNERVLIVSRLEVVLLGCWALYQAVYAQSILEKMLYAYTIYSAALTPVVLAAFYSKRVTAWGAVSAISVGTVVTLAWDTPRIKAMMHLPPVLAQRDAIFPALIAAVAAMVLVSVFTPRPRPEQLAQFGD